MSFATKEQLQELVAYMASQISVPTIGIGGGFAPIGTIISYMGTTAPQDYLICDGTAYAIADYPQLADFIETQFGAVDFFGGNGTTTFAVPDLRGEFLRGSGTNSHTGQGNGANVGTHQDATEIPRFKLSDDSSPKVLALQRFPSDGQSHYIGNSDSLVGGKSTVAASITVTTNSTASEEYMFTSRPTNTSVLYCIKAVCAGDVYSTSERVVGTWIDGKEVWQKTVVIPSRTLSANTVTRAELVNASVNPVLVGFDGFSERQGRHFALPYVSADKDGTKIYFNGSVCEIDGAIVYEVVNTAISSEITEGATITIRYTKTTD